MRRAPSLSRVEGVRDVRKKSSASEVKEKMMTEVERGTVERGGVLNTVRF
jgi:hypothetical protein